MTRNPTHLKITLLCLSAALAATCKPSSPPPAPTTTIYNMRGIIERLGTDTAPRTLIIRHESTPNMDSMAMPFYIDPAVPLTGLALGDKVSFQFEIDRATGAEHVTKLEKLPPDTVLTVPPPPTTTHATSMPAMPGM